jgi:MoxR-like ATPase
MDVFLAKITNRTNVDNILSKKVFTHQDIYNFESEMNVDSFVFLVFSGDKSRIDWEQGVIGFGHITRAPYDKGYNPDKQRYFKIDIQPDFILEHPLPPKYTKLHPKYQNELYDVPYVGANHFPNQAIAKTSGKNAEALFHLFEDTIPGAITSLNLDFDFLTKKDSATIKDDFKDYLLEKNKASTVSSYINALDQIPEYLNSINMECPFVWDENVNKEDLITAAKFVKSESMKENGGQLGGYLPKSHWNNGWFYSGVNNFITFLEKEIEENQSLVPNQVTNEDFDITKFISDINKTGLVFSEKMIFRFISSLLSKRFLLLTGLSGSGKTKLAQSFVNWITGKHSSTFLLLKEALKSERIIQNYKIHSISPHFIEIINISGSTGKIIPLPTSAIYEWYNSFVKGAIDSNDDPKEKRHEIGEKSIYQKYLHGFYGELFKISSVMYEINQKVADNFIEQYKIIPVGADWTNRDQLIGFPNAMNQEEYIFPDTGALNLIMDAINNPSHPFFLILDEMNMSHVERYFSDFLSAMESNDKIHLHDKDELLHILPKNILLPNNLFIIGTVNIDETTYMFSPKVLDRANVLEFRVDEDEMKTFFNDMQEVNIDTLSGEGIPMSRSFLDRSLIPVLDESQKLRDELIPFFNKLQEAGAEFGYRTAFEISTFIKKCSDLVNDKMTRDEIVDAAIMQKLLPKLHGSRNKIERILKDLGMLCLENSDNQDFSESDPQKIKYPVSYEKLQRMHKRVIADGFTSYAEA